MKQKKHVCSWRVEKKNDAKKKCGAQKIRCANIVAYLSPKYHRICLL